jgi:hypothetical protein
VERLDQAAEKVQKSLQIFLRDPAPLDHHEPARARKAMAAKDPPMASMNAVRRRRRERRCRALKSKGCPRRYAVAHFLRDRGGHHAVPVSRVDGVQPRRPRFRRSSCECRPPERRSAKVGLSPFGPGAICPPISHADQVFAGNGPSGHPVAVCRQPFRSHRSAEDKPSRSMGAST